MVSTSTVSCGLYASLVYGLWVRSLCAIVVTLTVFVLGPTVAEFIRQSVLRNIRGILDVRLAKRSNV